MYNVIRAHDKVVKSCSTKADARNYLRKHPDHGFAIQYTKPAKRLHESQKQRK